MTWIYHQKTGHIYHDHYFIGTGYSGFGSGLNNPHYEGAHYIGVIPRGRYLIKPIAQRNLGENEVMVLTSVLPKKHDNFDCFIRGDNSMHNGAQSIILDHKIRKEIAASRDYALQVIQ